MSKIIRSAAHFVVCSKCFAGYHGFLRTADGEVEYELFDKKNAKEKVRELVKEGKIAEDEKLEVIRQIEESSLPFCWEEIPPDIRMELAEQAIDEQVEVLQASTEHVPGEEPIHEQRHTHH